MTQGPRRLRTTEPPPIEVKRRLYAKEAPTYDREADVTERWLFGAEHRDWACSKATGDTLEVAIGTGLNLAHYPRTCASPESTSVRTCLPWPESGRRISGSRSG